MSFEEPSGADTLLDTIGSRSFRTRRSTRKSQAEAQSRLRAVAAKSAEYYEVKSHAAYVITEGTPQNARIFVKGDPEMPGTEVPRGFLTILGGQKIAANDKGSGRLQLAEWITDPKNPLTARVMVNRIWTWHFGQGLVATPDDFGTRGERPSSGTSRLPGRSIRGRRMVSQKMHRLIMLSRAYQTAVGHNAKAAAADPRNAYLSRFSRAVWMPRNCTTRC